MRQVTIKKIISSDGRVRRRVVRRVRTFKSGEIVKFNTPDGVKIAVVTTDGNYKCHECVFFNFSECPRFGSNPLQGACALCDHHRYGDMNMYFKPLDTIMEDL